MTLFFLFFLIFLYFFVFEVERGHQHRGFNELSLTLEEYFTGAGELVLNILLYSSYLSFSVVKKNLIHLNRSSVVC